MSDHAHLKLHDHFVTLTDMKLHVQSQLYTSISFWDIKFKKPLWEYLGMPDPTPVKLYHQFVALIDM